MLVKVILGNIKTLKNALNLSCQTDVNNFTVLSLFSTFSVPGRFVHFEFFLSRDAFGSPCLVWSKCCELTRLLSFSGEIVYKINLKACVHYFILYQKKTFHVFLKMLFISFKELFSFSIYSNFCSFFPSFPHSPEPKDQMKL